MNDITLDEAVAFFHSAGFLVLTDEDLLGTGDEDDGEDED